LRVKNRMRVIRSSGSVRGGDGDIPAYSARCFGNWSWFAGAVIEFIETRKRIGLHHACPTGQMLARIGAVPGSRVFEEGRRRILAAERSVIAHVDPNAPELGFLLRQDRNRGVVSVHTFGGEDVIAQPGDNRLKRNHARPDPIGERGRVDLDAFARIGRALTVQRLVIQELGDEDHGEQARSGEAARDRMRGRRGLGDRFAVPTRELLAHMLDDLPAARIAFERFRDDLAELAQAKTAASATSAGRRFDNALDRQIVGQFAGAARRAGALLLHGRRRRDLGFGLFLCLRLFKVLDRQFELIDEKRAAL